MPPSKNPLSCARCKDKKIRCNKEEPVCDRCRASNAHCVYNKRRPKTRQARTRGDVLAEILQRLDNIENGGRIPPSEQSLYSTKPSEASPDDASSNSSGEEDLSVSLGEENDGTTELSTTMYRIFHEARSTTFNVLNQQSDLTPANTPGKQNAFDALDNVMTNFETFQLKPDQPQAYKASTQIPKELQRLWVEGGLNKMSVDMFMNFVERPLMSSLTDIIGLPFVQTDVSALLLYHSLMFIGWKVEDKASPQTEPYGEIIYVKCLELVLQWQKSTKLSTMDLTAACLMTWIAIDNFDYQLSWRFHVKASKIVRNLKLNLFDAEHPDTLGPDDAVSNSIRIGFWGLIQTDYLFRLYYNKPATISNLDLKVKYPSMVSLTAEQPASFSVSFIVMRASMEIVKDFFELVEKKNNQNLLLEVQKLGEKMEKLIEDWNIMGFLQNTPRISASKWLYAQILIHGYTSIILMERKALETDRKTASYRSVTSARQVLSVITRVSNTAEPRPNFGPVNFVAFYPFVAFFALYYHILRRAEPERAEEDLDLMQQVGKIMEICAKDKRGFMSVSNCVNVLNTVLRHLISTKRESFESMNYGQAQMPTPASLTDLSNFGEYNSIDLNGAQWPFQMTLEQGLQSPMAFMQSVETEILAQSWNDSWWDFGGMPNQ